MPALKNRTCGRRNLLTQLRAETGRRPKRREVIARELEEEPLPERIHLARPTESSCVAPLRSTREPLR